MFLFRPIAISPRNVRACDLLASPPYILWARDPLLPDQDLVRPSHLRIFLVPEAMTLVSARIGNSSLMPIEGSLLFPASALNKLPYAALMLLPSLGNAFDFEEWLLRGLSTKIADK